MKLALLHRRLTAGMALSALAAYVAGAGVEAGTTLTGLVLCAAVVRLPPASWNARIESVSRLVLLSMCAWLLYVAFVLVGDFMPAVMGMMLFLVAAENARPLDTGNDARLYLIAAALFVAATAYYPGPAFGVAFAAFVVFTTLAMMIGFLRRQSERHGGAEVRVGRGFLGATVALSAVTLLVSLLVFLVFPRLPRAWNVQGRPAGGEVMAGFSDEVHLGQHGSRIRANPQVMFRVEFPDEPPADAAATYWRGRSFDHFDGIRWTRTDRFSRTTPAPGSYVRRWGAPDFNARIFGGPPGAQVLFGRHPVVHVEPSSAIRVVHDPAGDVLFFGSDVPVYRIASAPARPPERLLHVEGRTPPWMAPYLQLPSLDPAVKALADSLTAPHAARIDRVRAVERYLSTEFGYTLDLPRTRRDAGLEAFLFRRREGHCEYFATAMVVLLRTQGIPARNVTGFAGGEWNRFGGYLAVTGNDAHAWAEVWFPGAGWVPFEPTPAARLDVVREEEQGGWTWPGRPWFGALEHRWYKWVLDYNLDRQLGLFRDVGDVFSGRGRGPQGPTAPGGFDVRAGLPAAAVAAAALLLLWAGRVRRGPARRAETTAYLALRRAYARAGLGPRDGGPLAFAEALRRRGAPGAGPAGGLVDLYVRARFAGEEIGEEGRRRMRSALAEAKRALRAARRARRRRRVRDAARFAGGRDPQNSTR